MPSLLSPGLCYFVGLWAQLFIVWSYNKSGSWNNALSSTPNTTAPIDVVCTTTICILYLRIRFSGLLYLKYLSKLRESGLGNFCGTLGCGRCCIVFLACLAPLHSHCLCTGSGSLWHCIRFGVSNVKFYRTKETRQKQKRNT